MVSFLKKGANYETWETHENISYRTICFFYFLHDGFSTLAAAEDNYGNSDIYGMDSYIQAAGMDVAFVDETDNQNEESSSVVEKNQIQSRTGGISTFGISDYELIDIIVECTQYDESLQECIDRMDSDAKRWELQLANATLMKTHDMFLEQTDMITEELYNMISSAHGEMYGLVERLDTKLSTVSFNITKIEAFTKYFYIETDGSTVRDVEGLWTKLIKRFFKAVERIDEDTSELSTWLDAWQMRDADNYVKEGYDGQIATYFKQGIGKPIQSVGKNTLDLYTWFTRSFSLDPKNIDFINRELDGDWTELIKMGFKNTADIEQLYKDDFEISWYEPKLYDNEGHFIKLFKSQWADLVSIKSYAKKISESGGGSGASAESIFEVFEDSLDDFQKSFDKMVKYLKDFEFTGEGGTNLWDVLESMIKELGDGFTGLLDTLGDLLDFTESMMDFFIEVFVPKENVIKDGFDGLNQLLAAKFKSTTALKNILNSTFSQSQKDFEDIHVTLPQYGNVKILESSYINAALPVTRNLIGGAMILITSVWAYRRITTELIT